MSANQYKPGDKVVDITEGLIGEVIDGEPLDPSPALRWILFPSFGNTGMSFTRTQATWRVHDRGIPSGA